MRNTLLGMLLALPLAAAATDRVGSRAPLEGQLLIVGSSTMAPLVTAIARRFAEVHPRVTIVVETGGSGRGIADVRAGKAHIGMASRALGERESDLYGIPIARDGVAIIVHRDNAVKALTDEQIAAIFTGRVTSWKELGGSAAPISVLNVEPGYGAPEMFTHYFKIEYASIKARAVLGDNALRFQAIAADPGATTYTSMGEAERAALKGAPIRLLPVQGVAATSRNIRTGSYPLSRALTLLTRAAPAGLSKEFINFSLTSEITDLVKQHEFIPYLD
jgi:phosphate transport system substrate-binding protein